jgi:putative sterol carrier protein
LTVVARFLSDEWVDAVRDAGLSVGQTTVECAITGAPDGDVKLHAHGADVAVGPAANADVSLTLPYPEAIAIARGELEPSVAFMQGRMKTAGDPGRLLDLLAATATPAFRDGLARVGGDTEF